jgi:hypothetical protein
MMKNIILILIVSFFTSCISRNETQYVLRDNTFIMKAKFFKIETKNGIHIFHFKNDSIEGVFVKAVDSNFVHKNYLPIKLNRSYNLVLNKEMQYANCFNNGMPLETTYVENDILVWEPSMKSKYFTGCENIIGNMVNPRFTILKYMNPVKY